MFDRPDAGERAVLVHLDFPNENDREDAQEFRELVRSAGVEPVGIVTGSRSQPSARFFVGSGKLEEIITEKAVTDADVVLFNHALSPSQQRNLEGSLECRVIDRTGVILDIFAQRARTHEGKLQVELAQLEYISTRLIRGWTHLERQKGGIGLRGPGETQLETDRRLLRGRIKALTGRLEKVRKQRDQGRRSRTRAEIPTISLVGYTNAGKSTLFNRLTDSGVYAADQLFATLDPTLRRIDFPDIGRAILVDTVGFIRHLPHKLVDAFRATLEETISATLLLHVIDGADSRRLDNIEAVEQVLDEIGAGDVKVLRVYNKIDLLDDGVSRIDRDEDGAPVRVWLSANSGEGTDLLSDAVAELLSDEVMHCILRLRPEQGRLRAMLFESNHVIQEEYDDKGMARVEVRLQTSDFERMLKRCNVPRADLLIDRL
ncbi:GTPase HflX [Oleiphilus sp. HI0009]|uniref:ribosome rescue GTPase HflX n=3 Tax=Oleiphilus TaxID=141450 RepID=UPI0007C349FD|nr:MULTISPECIES: ribosome rescue GTPase HflX [unclassified Oleiphilus]KZX75573.1 GTPase HflX [Oleiphilus sp. HI0009]KZY61187.1 GTPase HflX [Oleiphilus sp. HI0066]KZY68838.1 GTPase HflX [Oleiphilus sp. HI0067]KZY69423.1 GTPase HflX [Oleiphilus sp. HI0066]